LADDLCLPDPDFWATSARAFAQLLMENPSYVIPTRITQLNTIEQEGRLIAGALHQLAVNDAGADPNGTGNQTLDAAINYFRYWGDGTNHSGGAPPSLSEALKNDEQAYLASQPVPGDPTVSYAGIDPWGAPSQAPDLAGLQNMSSFAHVPVCPGTVGPPYDPGNYTLSGVTQPMIGFIDADVLNAVRLGLGRISACWAVSGGNFHTDAAGDAYADLDMTVVYTYTGNDRASGQVGVINAHDPAAPICKFDGNQADLGIGEYASVAAGWGLNPSPNHDCPDMTSVLGIASNQTKTNGNDVADDAANALPSVLSALRRNVYNDITGNGTGLTAGVQAAATRLSGANALLDGYISLGLPQALADDDALHSLVAGVNADTFDPASGGLPGTAPANDVPTQVLNLYKTALADDGPTFGGVTDPADLIANLVDQRAQQLENTIRAHIVAPGGQTGAQHAQVRLGAQGATAQATSAVFSEENPYIGPTLDRLAETAFVLTDEANHPSTTPGPPTAPAMPAPGTPAIAGTAGTPGTTKATAARCTLKATSNKTLLAARKGKARKGAPKPGTVSLTVKCSQAGRVKVTGTLTQLVGRKRAHGRQKSRGYRLGPANGTANAGKALTLTIKLPAAAVSALGHGANESAVLTVVLSNPLGAGRATTRIGALHATR
jgi:hypothetical protein